MPERVFTKSELTNLMLTSNNNSVLSAVNFLKEKYFLSDYKARILLAEITYNKRKFPTIEELDKAFPRISQVSDFAAQVDKVEEEFFNIKNKKLGVYPTYVNSKYTLQVDDDFPDLDILIDRIKSYPVIGDAVKKNNEDLQKILSTKDVDAINEHLQTFPEKSEAVLQGYFLANNRYLDRYKEHLKNFGVDTFLSRLTMGFAKGVIETIPLSTNVTTKPLGLVNEEEILQTVNAVSQLFPEVTNKEWYKNTVKKNVDEISKLKEKEIGLGLNLYDMANLSDMAGLSLSMVPAMFLPSPTKFSAGAKTFGTLFKEYRAANSFIGATFKAFGKSIPMYTRRIADEFIKSMIYQTPAGVRDYFETPKDQRTWFYDIFLNRQLEYVSEVMLVEGSPLSILGKKFFAKEAAKKMGDMVYNTFVNIATEEITNMAQDLAKGTDTSFFNVTGREDRPFFKWGEAQKDALLLSALFGSFHLGMSAIGKSINQITEAKKIGEFALEFLRKNRFLVIADGLYDLASTGQPAVNSTQKVVASIAGFADDQSDQGIIRNFGNLANEFFELENKLIEDKKGKGVTRKDLSLSERMTIRLQALQEFLSTAAKLGEDKVITEKREQIRKQFGGERGIQRLRELTELFNKKPELIDGLAEAIANSFTTKELENWEGIKDFTDQLGIEDSKKGSFIKEAGRLLSELYMRKYLEAGELNKLDEEDLIILSYGLGIELNDQNKEKLQKMWQDYSYWADNLDLDKITAQSLSFTSFKTLKGSYTINPLLLQRNLLQYVKQNHKELEEYAAIEFSNLDKYQLLLELVKEINKKYQTSELNQIIEEYDKALNELNNADTRKAIKIVKAKKLQILKALSKATVKANDLNGLALRRAAIKLYNTLTTDDLEAKLGLEKVVQGAKLDYIDSMMEKDLEIVEQVEGLIARLEKKLQGIEVKKEVKERVEKEKNRLLDFRRNINNKYEKMREEANDALADFLLEYFENYGKIDEDVKKAIKERIKKIMANEDKDAIKKIEEIGKSMFKNFTMFFKIGDLNDAYVVSLIESVASLNKKVRDFISGKYEASKPKKGTVEVKPEKEQVPPKEKSKEEIEAETERKKKLEETNKKRTEAVIEINKLVDEIVTDGNNIGVTEGNQEIIKKVNDKLKQYEDKSAEYTTPLLEYVLRFLDTLHDKNPNTLSVDEEAFLDAVKTVSETDDANVLKTAADTLSRLIIWTFRINHKEVQQYKIFRDAYEGKDKTPKGRLITPLEYGLERQISAVLIYNIFFKGNKEEFNKVVELLKKFFGDFTVALSKDQTGKKTSVLIEGFNYDRLDQFFKNVIRMKLPFLASVDDYSLLTILSDLFMIRLVQGLNESRMPSVYTALENAAKIMSEMGIKEQAILETLTNIAELFTVIDDIVIGKLDPTNVKDYDFIAKRVEVRNKISGIIKKVKVEKAKQEKVKAEKKNKDENEGKKEGDNTQDNTQNERNKIEKVVKDAVNGINTGTIPTASVQEKENVKEQENIKEEEAPKIGKLENYLLGVLNETFGSTGTYDFDREEEINKRIKEYYYELSRFIENEPPSETNKRLIQRIELQREAAKILIEGSKWLEELEIFKNNEEAYRSFLSMLLPYADFEKYARARLELLLKDPEKSKTLKTVTLNKYSKEVSDEDGSTFKEILKVEANKKGAVKIQRTYKIGDKEVNVTFEVKNTKQYSLIATAELKEENGVLKLVFDPEKAFLYELLILDRFRPGYVSKAASGLIYERLKNITFEKATHISPTARTVVFNAVLIEEGYRDKNGKIYYTYIDSKKGTGVNKEGVKELEIQDGGTYQLNNILTAPYEHYLHVFTSNYGAKNKEYIRENFLSKLEDEQLYELAFLLDEIKSFASSIYDGDLENIGTSLSRLMRLIMDEIVDRKKVTYADVLVYIAKYKGEKEKQETETPNEKQDKDLTAQAETLIEEISTEKKEEGEEENKEEKNEIDVDLFLNTEEDYGTSDKTIEQKNDEDPELYPENENEIDRNLSDYYNFFNLLELFNKLGVVVKYEKIDEVAYYRASDNSVVVNEKYASGSIPDRYILSKLHRILRHELGHALLTSSNILKNTSLTYTKDLMKVTDRLTEVYEIIKNNSPKDALEILISKGYLFGDAVKKEVKGVLVQLIQDIQESRFLEAVFKWENNRVNESWDEILTSIYTQTDELLVQLMYVLNPLNNIETNLSKTVKNNLFRQFRMIISKLMYEVIRNLEKLLKVKVDNNLLKQLNTILISIEADFVVYELLAKQTLDELLGIKQSNIRQISKGTIKTVTAEIDKEEQKISNPTTQEELNKREIGNGNVETGNSTSKKSGDVDATQIEDMDVGIFVPTYNSVKELIERGASIEEIEQAMLSDDIFKNLINTIKTNKAEEYLKKIEDGSFLNALKQQLDETEDKLKQFENIVSLLIQKEELFNFPMEESLEEESEELRLKDEGYISGITPNSIMKLIEILMEIDKSYRDVKKSVKLMDYIRLGKVTFTILFEYLTNQRHRALIKYIKKAIHYDYSFASTLKLLARGKIAELFLKLGSFYDYKLADIRYDPSNNIFSLQIKGAGSTNSKQARINTVREYIQFLDFLPEILSLTGLTANDFEVLQLSEIVKPGFKRTTEEEELEALLEEVTSDIEEGYTPAKKEVVQPVFLNEIVDKINVMVRQLFNGANTVYFGHFADKNTVPLLRFNDKVSLLKFAVKMLKVYRAYLYTLNISPEIIDKLEKRINQYINILENIISLDTDKVLEEVKNVVGQLKEKMGTQVIENDSNLQEIKQQLRVLIAKSDISKSAKTILTAVLDYKDINYTIVAFSFPNVQTITVGTLLDYISKHYLSSTNSLRFLANQIYNQTLKEELTKEGELTSGELSLMVSIAFRTLLEDLKLGAKYKSLDDISKSSTRLLRNDTAINIIELYKRHIMTSAKIGGLYSPEMMNKEYLSINEKLVSLADPLFEQEELTATTDVNQPYFIGEDGEIYIRAIFIRTKKGERVNKVGISTLDGATMGTFRTINFIRKIQGGVLRGALKNYVYNREDGLYLKHAMYYFAKNDPINQALEEKGIGLVISDEAEKHKLKELHYYDSIENALNSSSIKTYLIKLRDIHRNKEGASTVKEVKGLSQLLNTTGILINLNPSYSEEMEYSIIDEETFKIKKVSGVDAVKILQDYMSSLYEEPIKEFTERFITGDNSNKARLIELFNFLNSTYEDKEEYGHDILVPLLDTIANNIDPEVSTYGELAEIIKGNSLETKLLTIQKIKDQLIYMNHLYPIFGLLAHYLNSKFRTARKAGQKGFVSVLTPITTPYVTDAIKVATIRLLGRSPRLKEEAPDLYNFLEENKDLYEKMRKLTLDVATALALLRNNTAEVLEITKRDGSKETKNTVDYYRELNNELLKVYDELINKLRESKLNQHQIWQYYFASDYSLGYGYTVYSIDAMSDYYNPKNKGKEFEFIPNERVIQYIIPSDSQASMTGSRVLAFLPEGIVPLQSVIMNSEYAQGLAGRDYDIDVIYTIYKAFDNPKEKARWANVSMILEQQVKRFVDNLYDIMYEDFTRVSQDENFLEPSEYEREYIYNRIKGEMFEGGKRYVERWIVESNYQAIATKLTYADSNDPSLKMQYEYVIEQLKAVYNAVKDKVNIPSNTFEGFIEAISNHSENIEFLKELSSTYKGILFREIEQRATPYIEKIKEVKRNIQKEFSNLKRTEEFYEKMDLISSQHNRLRWMQVYLGANPFLLMSSEKESAYFHPLDFEAIKVSAMYEKNIGIIIRLREIFMYRTVVNQDDLILEDWNRKLLMLLIATNDNVDFPKNDNKFFYLSEAAILFRKLKNRKLGEGDAEIENTPGHEPSDSLNYRDFNRITINTPTAFNIPRLNNISGSRDLYKLTIMHKLAKLLLKEMKSKLRSKDTNEFLKRNLEQILGMNKGEIKEIFIDFNNYLITLKLSDGSKKDISITNMIYFSPADYEKLVKQLPILHISNRQGQLFTMMQNILETLPDEANMKEKLTNLLREHLEMAIDKIELDRLQLSDIVRIYGQLLANRAIFNILTKLLKLYGLGEVKVSINKGGGTVTEYDRIKEDTKKKLPYLIPFYNAVEEWAKTKSTPLNDAKNLIKLLAMGLNSKIQLEIGNKVRTIGQAIADVYNEAFKVLEVAKRYGRKLSYLPPAEAWFYRVPGSTQTYNISDVLDIEGRFDNRLAKLLQYPEAYLSFLLSLSPKIESNKIKGEMVRRIVELINSLQLLYLGNKNQLHQYRLHDFEIIGQYLLEKFFEDNISVEDIVKNLGTQSVVTGTRTSFSQYFSLIASNGDMLVIDVRDNKIYLLPAVNFNKTLKDGTSKISSLVQNILLNSEAPDRDKSSLIDNLIAEKIITDYSNFTGYRQNKTILRTIENGNLFRNMNEYNADALIAIDKEQGQADANKFFNEFDRVNSNLGNLKIYVPLSSKELTEEKKVFLASRYIEDFLVKNDAFIKKLDKEAREVFLNTVLSIPALISPVPDSSVKVVYSYQISKGGDVRTLRIEPPRNKINEIGLSIITGGVFERALILSNIFTTAINNYIESQEMDVKLISPLHAEYVNVSNVKSIDEGKKSFPYQYRAEGDLYYDKPKALRKSFEEGDFNEEEFLNDIRQLASQVAAKYSVEDANYVNNVEAQARTLLLTYKDSQDKETQDYNRDRLLAFYTSFYIEKDRKLTAFEKMLKHPWMRTFLLKARIFSNRLFSIYTTLPKDLMMSFKITDKYSEEPQDFLFDMMDVAISSAAHIGDQYLRPDLYSLTDVFFYKLSSFNNEIGSFKETIFRALNVVFPSAGKQRTIKEDTEYELQEKRTEKLLDFIGMFPYITFDIEKTDKGVQIKLFRIVGTSEEINYIRMDVEDPVRILESFIKAFENQLMRVNYITGQEIEMDSLTEAFNSSFRDAFTRLNSKDALRFYLEKHASKLQELKEFIDKEYKGDKEKLRQDLTNAFILKGVVTQFRKLLSRSKAYYTALEKTGKLTKGEIVYIRNEIRRLNKLIETLAYGSEVKNKHRVVLKSNLYIPKAFNRQEYIERVSYSYAVALFVKTERTGRIRDENGEYTEEFLSEWNSIRRRLIRQLKDKKVVSGLLYTQFDQYLTDIKKSDLRLSYMTLLSDLTATVEDSIKGYYTINYFKHAELYENEYVRNKVKEFLKSEEVTSRLNTTIKSVDELEVGDVIVYYEPSAEDGFVESGDYAFIVRRMRVEEINGDDIELSYMTLNKEKTITVNRNTLMAMQLGGNMVTGMVEVVTDKDKSGLPGNGRIWHLIRVVLGEGMSVLFRGFLNVYKSRMVQKIGTKFKLGEDRVGYFFIRENNKYIASQIASLLKEDEKRAKYFKTLGSVSQISQNILLDVLYSGQIDTNKIFDYMIDNKNILTKWKTQYQALRNARRLNRHADSYTEALRQLNEFTKILEQRFALPELEREGKYTFEYVQKREEISQIRDYLRMKVDLTALELNETFRKIESDPELKERMDEIYGLFKQLADQGNFALVYNVDKDYAHYIYHKYLRDTFINKRLEYINEVEGSIRQLSFNVRFLQAYNLTKNFDMALKFALRGVVLDHALYDSLHRVVASQTERGAFLHALRHYNYNRMINFILLSKENKAAIKAYGLGRLLKDFFKREERYNPTAEFTNLLLFNYLMFMIGAVIPGIRWFMNPILLTMFTLLEFAVYNIIEPEDDKELEKRYKEYVRLREVYDSEYMLETIKEEYDKAIKYAIRKKNRDKYALISFMSLFSGLGMSLTTSLALFAYDSMKNKSVKEAFDSYINLGAVQTFLTLYSAFKDVTSINRFADYRFMGLLSKELTGLYLYPLYGDYSVDFTDFMFNIFTLGAYGRVKYSERGEVERARREKRREEELEKQYDLLGLDKSEIYHR
ncbi:MAG: hypothetical protein HPY57_13095 [Ignavibacteria bacterium]|nr:hypothetical protein [Ignavibacteria bacterium]